MRTPSRSGLLAVLLAAAVSTSLSGCATGNGDGGDVATVDASSVNATLAALADTRAQLDAAAGAALQVAVRVETIVAGMRSPSSIDTTLDEVPSLVATAAEVDPARIAELHAAVDADVEEAQAALSAALVDVEPGSWQERFLRSQQDVVDALRAWSATHTAVDALLAEHWAVWHDATDAAGTLDEDRWRYRSPEEAAGTWEIAIADDLDAIATAATAVPPVVEARDAAAAAVQAADAAAAAVFADRPADQ